MSISLDSHSLLDIDDFSQGPAQLGKRPMAFIWQLVGLYGNAWRWMDLRCDKERTDCVNGLLDVIHGQLVFGSFCMLLWNLLAIDLFL